MTIITRDSIFVSKRVKFFNPFVFLTPVPRVDIRWGFVDHLQVTKKFLQRAGDVSNEESTLTTVCHYVVTRDSKKISGCVTFVKNLELCLSVIWIKIVHAL